MCHPRSVVALPFAARLRAIVLAVGFGCGSGVPSPAIEPVRPFESLRGWASPNTTIQSVAIDPNEGSCRVTAIVTHPPANDRVAVWIALPLKGWNGRFWGTGGSAWAGGSPESLGPRVREGYVVGATDTGHEGRSASFARDGQNRLDWQAIRDNAYLGIHDMTILGKALAEELYGQPPRHAYFYGGSTGGRQGLAEAQRYPGDYDGVVALFPSIHRDRYVPAELWPQVVMVAARHFVSEAKLGAATAAAVRACGTGGIIPDPAQCNYDPRALIGTRAGDGLFTEADAEVVRKIWQGPRGTGGRFLWYGPPRGADLAGLARTSGSPLEGQPSGEGLGWYQYFLGQGAQWDWKTLTPGRFELLFDQSVEEFGAVFGTDNPDLRAFAGRGGKLIIMHGWADQIVPPQGTVDYYRQVQAQSGGPEPTAKFARLFMVAGAGHGFAAPGPAPRTAEIAASIIRWVEEGQAPERFAADLQDRPGHVVRTFSLTPVR